jgi:cell division protein FtsI/penicillin-binding protein 2
MDPKTGEVLALASRPSFQLTKLNLEDPGQADLYRNRAVTDLYDPGSVMKTITMASAIDLGLVSPDTTYFDSGEADIEGGAVIRNWDFSAHGTTTMTQVLQYSLNTGAVWVSGLLGPDRFYDSIKRFGFGEPTDIGLGGEPAGIVRTNQEDSWYPIDLATNSFGQGISVTPVQMITAISALVNGGLLMRPYIVKEVTGPNHRVYEPVVVRRAVSEETSRALVQMMEAVVGRPGHLAQVPGYRVGGKTGTTTFPDRSDTLASFVGFAPVDDPKFIMLARIDSPKDNSLGGVVAAPIFPRLAPKILAYMGVPPDNALVQSP